MILVLIWLLFGSMDHNCSLQVESHAPEASVDLSNKVSRIASVQDSVVPFYAWLAADKVMLLKKKWKLPDPNVERRQGAFGPADEITVADTRTGHSYVAEGLTVAWLDFRRASESSGSLHHRIDEVSLCPDRRHIMLAWGPQETGSIGGFSGLILATMDGRTWRDHNTWRTRGIWLRDGKHWLSLAQADRKLTWAESDPVTLEPKREGDLRTYIGFPADWYTYSQLLGQRPGGRLLLASWATNPPHVDQVVLLDFGLSPSDRPPHRSTVQLPYDHLVSEIALSPDGGELAWLVSSQFWKDGVAREGRHELWKSHPDGTGLAQIGWLPGSAEDFICVREVPGFLQWNPDGKHVSFVYADSIVTLRVK